ncbi:MAG: hypothetical protein JNL90_21295 [Planctomycetes bacterium]|nr:hypothetical protein [Planctomycetota bacterium]
MIQLVGAPRICGVGAAPDSVGPIEIGSFVDNATRTRRYSSSETAIRFRATAIVLEPAWSCSGKTSGAC